MLFLLGIETGPRSDQSLAERQRCCEYDVVVTPAGKLFGLCLLDSLQSRVPRGV